MSSVSIFNRWARCGKRGSSGGDTRHFRLCIDHLSTTLPLTGWIVSGFGKSRCAHRSACSLSAADCAPTPWRVGAGPRVLVDAGSGVLRAGCHGSRTHAPVFSWAGMRIGRVIRCCFHPSDFASTYVRYGLSCSLVQYKHSAREALIQR